MRHFGSLLFVLASAAFAQTAELEKGTAEAFDRHAAKAEREMHGVASGKSFLWADADRNRKERMRRGEVVIEPRGQSGLVEVDGGLIHDWIGGMFVPGATLSKTLAAIQDYARHKDSYPEVTASRIIRREGDFFKVFLRLRKKKVVTVVLNTEHDVQYTRTAPNRVRSRSIATRIAEVKNVDEPGMQELPPGKDSGFLWRLNSYWRFEEADRGVYIECEAISLTRDVPTGLGWMIKPIIRDLPKESLEGTLAATRKAVL
jgi:hypothetical protein